jgi:hypothetical protein
MHKNILVGCSFFVGLLILKPTANVSAQEPAAGLPAWLQEKLDREVRRRGKKRKVTMLEGALTGQVKAKKKVESTQYEWGTYLTLDPGSQGAPMECYVFKDPNQPAKLLPTFSETTIAAVADANKATVDVREIQSVTVDHVDGRPYLLGQWLFTLKTEGGETAAGQAKVAAGLAGATTLSCTHSEIGYSSTFKSLFTELLASLEFTGEQQSPYYKELYMMSMAGQRVGFFQNQYELDADGDHQITLVESIALPLNSSTLSTSDGSTMEWVRPDGSLINSFSVDVENGEVTRNLSLDPIDEGNWKVEGTIQGKNYAATLEGVDVVQSNLAQIQVLRDVVADPQRQTGELVGWLPDADPGGLTRIAFSQNKDERSGTMQFGPLTMQIQIGKDGMMQSMDMDVGNGATATLERVWFDGEVQEID